MDLPDLNLADAYDAIAAAVPDADAVVRGDRRLSWADYEIGSRRAAAAMAAHGVERGTKVAFYLRNRVEYLVAQYACFRLGAVACNVNFRYTAEELGYLLDNAEADLILFEADLADRVEAAVGPNPSITCVQVGSSDAPAWATTYEELIAGTHPDPPAQRRSGADLWFLYTGGTTGMPKAVMWEHSALIGTTKVYFDGLGLEIPRTADQAGRNVAEIHERGKVIRLGIGAPLIHGTANLAAQAVHLQGGCVVMLESRSFDAEEQLRLIERERITNLAIVGDVLARPLAEALERADRDGRPFDLSSLRVVQSSGVMWSAPVKERLRAFKPSLVIVDSLGSSEGVDLASDVSRSAGEAATARFRLSDHAAVFTEDGRRVEPGSGERGLLAVGGALPLGYFKDPAKTAATYRIVDGRRWAIAGDWATVEADGTIVLLGRGSVCINTGGEKVYPEEVEEVLKLHPAVVDCNVVGLPDERWGERVTAVVEVDGAVTDNDLVTHARLHLAGHKLPRQIVRVARFQRNPNGKSDYQWARQMATTDQP